MADSVGSSGISGLSSEEQAVYDELMAENPEPAKKTAVAPYTPVTEPDVTPPPLSQPRTPQREPN